MLNQFHVPVQHVTIVVIVGHLGVIAARPVTELKLEHAHVVYM